MGLIHSPVASDALHLNAPMGGDWTHIYLYVAGGETKDEAKFEVPEDIRVETLTESQWRDLKQLKEGKAEDLETRPAQPSFF